MSIPVNIINSNTVFPEDCETHYASSAHITPGNYPQVHDFYEFVLVTEGTLTVIVNQESLHLNACHLLLIRPGDVHSKVQTGAHKHINLAFPSYTIHALFDYLYHSANKLQFLLEEKRPPLVRLTQIDTFMTEKRLLHLNHFSATAIEQKNTCLRSILVDLIFSHVMPSLENQYEHAKENGLPFWLKQAIDGLSDPQNLLEGMDYMTEQTNRSAEHICRTFRKYLGTSPSAYLNAKRLNYAANLLTHTDMEITDIIYECGFQSVNYFYHSFKKAYHMSPLKYKNQNHILK